MMQRLCGEPSCSLDPRDYVYSSNPTQEQLEEQLKLLGQLGVLGCKPALPFKEAPNTHHQDGSAAKHDQAFSASSAGVQALTSQHTREPCQDLDELLHDMFGSADCRPGFLDSHPESFSPFMGLGEQCMSDSSTDTDDEQVEHLLISNTGGWREWLGLEWQHSEACFPPESGTHLKLNHEAAAQAVNCALGQLG